MKQFIKILLIIFIGWGLYWNIAFIFSFDKLYPEECDLSAVAQVVSMKTEKQRSNSYVVKIISANLAKIKNTKLIVYTTKECDLNYGDIVQISGKFSKGDVARNYKGFNYRTYLKQNKIYGSLYSKNTQIVNHQSSLMEKIYTLKSKLYGVLKNLYQEDTEAFLQGILLGDSSNLEEEIKENFRNSSMSHILAISGMHISYVILGMQFVLDQCINDKKLKNVLILVMLIFFVLITGATPSCMRACIMSGMLLISQNFYRKNNFYVTILLTFLILLMLNPFNLLAVGMWLSFGGTLGIVLFHNFLKRYLECKFHLKSNVLKSFLDVFLISFVAQILIFPILVYCFNTISFTFFVSNLMIYFLVGPILAVGYFSMFLGVLFLPIGAVLAVLEEFLVMLIFKVAEICSQLPFSKIYVVTPDFWMLLAYYTLVGSFVMLFNRRKFQVLRFLLGKEMVKKCKKKVIAVGLIMVIIFGLVQWLPKDLRIYFIDVGQRRMLCYPNNRREKFDNRWWKSPRL